MFILLCLPQLAHTGQHDYLFTGALSWLPNVLYTILPGKYFKTSSVYVRSDVT